MDRLSSCEEDMIKAHFLFDCPEERIQVLVHPQSVIHSMVEFPDGVVLAQLGVPDMRFPIQYAFTWPVRTLPAELPVVFTLKSGSGYIPNLWNYRRGGYENTPRSNPYSIHAAAELKKICGKLKEDLKQ